MKVVIGKEAKSTLVAKGTQNPIWNEVCTNQLASENGNAMVYILKGTHRTCNVGMHAYNITCNNVACIYPTTSTWDK